MLDFIWTVLEYIPLIVAPVLLAYYTLVSAYVLAFNKAKTGLSFDYFLFTLVLVAGLLIGGAI